LNKARRISDNNISGSILNTGKYANMLDSRKLGFNTPLML